MAMTRPSMTVVLDTATPLIDVLEDVLYLDHPVRPSVRRRVQSANAEAIRTLRQLAADDEELLEASSARSIFNAVARNHGVKPRFMLTMREIGEQLAFEFASALLPTGARARLMARAARLQQRSAPANRLRSRPTDRRPDPRVEWIALAQAALALAAMVAAAVLATSGRASIGLGFSIASVAFLTFARAALAISSDRRAHLVGTDFGPSAPDRSPDIDLTTPFS
jgi:hypothetical protein